jgi:hypothetical protein
MIQVYQVSAATPTQRFGLEDARLSAPMLRFLHGLGCPQEDRTGIRAGGAQCYPEIPSEEGEHSGDRRARTCDGLGGVHDMTGEAELSGQGILVMEDNGVIARNATSARGAIVPVLDLLPTAKMHSPSSRTPDLTEEKPAQLRRVNSLAAAFGMTQSSAPKARPAVWRYPKWAFHVTDVGARDG